MRRSLLFTIAALVLLVIGVLIDTDVFTLVKAHGGDPDSIHACVNPGGQVRIVAFDGEGDPKEDCSGLLGNWVFQGPQGNLSELRGRWTPLDWAFQEPQDNLSSASMIADVTSSTALQEGEMFIIKNYADDGDNGGGTFRVENAAFHDTPDEGLVFSTNISGLVLVRLWDEANLHLDWYNPDPLNAQPQLHQAIMKLKHLGGGSLILGARNYTITDEWRIQDTGNIHIKGQGQGATTFVVNRTTEHTVGIRVTATTTTTHIAISDMTIEGPANSDETAWDLLLVNNNIHNLLIERVTFRRARRAGLRFSLSLPHTTKRVTVRDSDFEEISSSEMTQDVEGASLGGGGVLNMTIDNCDFVNTGSYDKHHAIYIWDAKDLAVTNSRFEGLNAAINLFGTGSENVIISGNRFRGVLSNISIP